MICDVFRLLFFCFVHFTLFRHWIQPFCYCCCCWCGDVARVVDPIKFELTTSTRMKYSGSYLFNAYLCVCCACACAHKIARLRPVETSCFSLFDYEHSTHSSSKWNEKRTNNNQKKSNDNKLSDTPYQLDPLSWMMTRLMMNANLLDTNLLHHSHMKRKKERVRGRRRITANNLLCCCFH